MAYLNEKSYLYRQVFVTDREKGNFLKESDCFINILKLINYSFSSYPTRASYSGQVDGFRNPMKNELKTRPCLKRFQTRMQIFLICILIKQQKHMAINNFI